MIFQSGKADTLVPFASSKALYGEAKQLKEIVWYEGDHGLDVPTRERVFDDAAKWIKARDAEIAPESAAASGGVREALDV